MSSNVNSKSEDENHQNVIQSLEISPDGTQTRMKSTDRRLSPRFLNNPFPSKLHDLLESNEFNEIICWQPNGRSFILHDAQGFVNSVMPLYFKQTQLRSFKRQLNLYDFKLIQSGIYKGGYYHPMFIRGESELCRSIQRISLKGKAQQLRTASSYSSNESTFCSIPQFVPSNVSKDCNSSLPLEGVSSARIDELFGRSFAASQFARQRNLLNRASFVHHSAGLLSANAARDRARADTDFKIPDLNTNTYQTLPYARVQGYDPNYATAMGHILSDPNRTSQIPAMGNWRDLNGDDAVHIQRVAQWLNQSAATYNTSRTFDGRASFVHHTAGLLSSTTKRAPAAGAETYSAGVNMQGHIPFKTHQDGIKQYVDSNADNVTANILCDPNKSLEIDAQPTEPKNIRHGNTSQIPEIRDRQDLNCDDAVDIQRVAHRLNQSAATFNTSRTFDGRASFVHHSAGLLSSTTKRAPTAGANIFSTALNMQSHILIQVHQDGTKQYVESNADNVTANILCDPNISLEIDAQPTEPKNKQDNTSQVPAVGNWRDLNDDDAVDIQRVAQWLNQSTTTSNTSRTFDGRASFVHHTAGLLSSTTKRAPTAGAQTFSTALNMQSHILIQVHQDGTKQYVQDGTNQYVQDGTKQYIDSYADNVTANILCDPNIHLEIDALPTEPNNGHDNTSQIPEIRDCQDLNDDDAVDIQRVAQWLNHSAATFNTSRTFDGRASFVHHTAGLLSSASVATKVNGSKDQMPSEAIVSCPFQQQSPDCFQQTDDLGFISNSNHASIVHDTVDIHIQPNRQDEDSTCILDASLVSSSLNQEFLQNCDHIAIPCSDFDDSDLCFDMSIFDNLEPT